MDHAEELVCSFQSFMPLLKNVMDGRWTLPIASTAPCEEGSDVVHHKFIAIFSEFRTITTNESEIAEVRGLTSSLSQKQSYCPSTWTLRASLLLRVGYPDLAIGDAYKALMLLNIYDHPGSRHEERVTTQLSRQLKLSATLPVMVPAYDQNVYIYEEFKAHLPNYAEEIRYRASMTLAQALFLTNCYVECYDFLKEILPKQRQPSAKMEALKNLAEQAQITENQSMSADEDYLDSPNLSSQEKQRSGSIVPQTYAWAESYSRRNGYTLAASRIKMSESSQERCHIQENSTVDSTIATTVVKKQEHGLSVRAGIDLPVDANFLVDNTFLSGIDDPMQRCSTCRCYFDANDPMLVKADCCGAQFCSDECMNLVSEFHYIMCALPDDLCKHQDMSLNPEQDSPGTIASNDLLYRVLAYIKTWPSLHPLQAPIIGNMIPAYHSSHPIPFSFKNDIKRPFAILELLGVDIFSNHGYDTWVLQTIQARLRHNVRAFTDDRKRHHVVINPLYTFFNHSCDPNVRLERHGSGSSHIVAITTRAVQQDEELFVNHLNDDNMALPYEKRQECLEARTGGECRCQRCNQEREALTFAASKQQIDPIEWAIRTKLFESSKEEHE